MNRCDSGRPVDDDDDDDGDVQRSRECWWSKRMVLMPEKREQQDPMEPYTCERIVVMLIQLKEYLGPYWLTPWFLAYIYPTILVYESHGISGAFVYCNIMQIIFFVGFEFWDESFKWTPLHYTIRSYILHVLDLQQLTKNIDELIMFCFWVLSWAAVPIVCFLCGHIVELPSGRLERMTSYTTMMTVTFVIAYIVLMLWVEKNLMEIETDIIMPSSLQRDHIEDSMLPDIPDLETVYEDISIPKEFKIDHIWQGLLEHECNRSDTVKEVSLNQIEQGEEAKELEMDVISLSSSTLSDFDIISDEEINLLQ
ncbi:uncharacterized protein LOC126833739 [Adelges cooleyi]|uniref:uncharacterized protein LOC126833739 n=1 Tax=Adelges cooleyi TaxID=133065 RepID=UPI0021804EF4|nr:uncharacterized protein LOC126833739 [Adelges cooleyi]